MDETQALAALTHIPHLGSMKIRLLVRHFGSGRAALEADVGAIGELPGFGRQVCDAITTTRHTQPWHRSFDLAHRLGVRLIPASDPEYPQGLTDLTDYPVILYVMGKFTQADQRGIAVVGTRQATLYGSDMAYRLSADLARAGFTIVSGLARGIDTQAHIAALEAGGRTVAVIGSGLADIYPKENSALAARIAQRGVVVSEFPLLTPPDRQNFPQRNRLVAAMTRATLLVEAPQRSGAMLTVHRAAGLHRRLFAIPGRADSESFRGNHAIIKSGEAQLVESAADICGAFSDLFATTSAMPRPAACEVILESEEANLLHLMPAEETNIDDLLQRTKLPIAKLSVLLMSLVLKKVVKEYPGKLFKKSPLVLQECP